MKHHGLIELAFSFGVVLALAFWELWRTPRPDEPEHESESGTDDVRDKDTIK